MRKRKREVECGGIFHLPFTSACNVGPHSRVLLQKRVNSPLSMQLLANEPGRGAAGDGSSTWVPTSLVKDLDGVSGS